MPPLESQFRRSGSAPRALLLAMMSGIVAIHGLLFAAGPVQTDYLKASNTNAGDYFGGGVAIEGETLVIGAPFEGSAAKTVDGNQADNSSSYQGAAYVFIKSAGGWSQQAYLKGSQSGEYDQFGSDVAISGDTIVVGAARNHGPMGEYEMGAAYVFVRNGRQWSQQALLRASNGGTGDNYGASVAIDGDTIVVGAPYEDGNATGVNGDGSNNDARTAGAAYVYTRNGTSWTQQAYLKATWTVPFRGPELGIQFGSSVAIEGDSIIIGAPEERSNATGINGDPANDSVGGAGAAYIFTRSESFWSHRVYLKSDNPSTLNRFGTAVAISGDMAVVGEGGSSGNSGTVHVFSNRGGAWSIGSRLKATHPAPGLFRFGSSLAFENDTLVVGTLSSAAGSAYVFSHHADSWILRSQLLASNGGIGIGSPAGDRFGSAVSISQGTAVITAPYEDSSAFGVNGDQTNDNAGGAGAAYVFTGVEFAPPATVEAVWTSADSVPLTADGYSAAFNTLNFKLDFAPPVGTELMVVKNTALSLIDGKFTNLAQGQQVDLAYGGITYPYVADYHGGTGNDLVLVAANNHCISWSGGAGGEAQFLNVGILVGKTIVSVAATSHTLILCSDGTLAALGNNSYGQLGDGTKVSSSVPKLVNRSGVLNGREVVAVAAGWTFSVALCSDGSIASWGQNFYSSLGNGSTIDSSLPVAVVGIGPFANKSAVAIAGGYYHVLALCTDGTVMAWGRGSNGQLGDGLRTNSTVPVAVATSGTLSGKKVTAIAAGQIHSLALCSDGTLAGWGNNDYRQLGTGQEGGEAYVPVAVDRSGVLAGKSIISMASGSYHNLVLCADGSLVSWGFNQQGQVGSNSMVGYVARPVLVDRSGTLAGKTINTVAAGAFHSLATCTDGTMAFWGGLTDPSPVPTQEEFSSRGRKFIRAAAASSSQSSVGFLAAPPPPRATTLPATPVSSSEVVLNGEVAANGSITAVNFQYGTTTAYGTTVTASPSDVPGTDVVPVSARLTGLKAGTTYHFRVIAASSFDFAPGADLVFVTPKALAPTITSPISSEITATAATLGGTVTSDGGGTIRERGVVYSITSINADPKIGGKGVFRLGTSGSTGAFTVRTNALGASTSYSFKAYATNSAGTVYTTPASTFTTVASDLAVSMTASPPTVAKNGIVTFRIDVSNNGPLAASDTTVTDILPPELAFVSASAPAGWTSSLPVSGASGPVSFRHAGTLAKGEHAGFTISARIRPSTPNGTLIINTASTPATESDSNRENNSASTQTAVGTDRPGALRLASKGKLNPQTGLFEVFVKVTNTTPVAIDGFRLHVDCGAYLKAHPSLELYHAGGPQRHGKAYVDHLFPVAVDGEVQLTLSFYTSNRKFPAPFKPKLTAELPAAPKLAALSVAPAEPAIQPTLAILPDRSVRLEFAAVPGRWYRVEFTSDLVHWQACPVPVQALANPVRWIDSGPPLTDLPPAQSARRFYRVSEIDPP